MTNLLELFEDVYESIDNGKHVDVIYLDFDKAFDKVPHSFIHCRHLYSAFSSGTTQKRSQPQRGRIMLF